MKLLAQTARILVGIIFIFSGFVKVVDPVGTGIKLEEYFEVFAQDLPSFTHFFLFFAHHSLVLSLVFCALEVILGIAVLVAYRMKLTAWVLLSIIVFFTFLTFYSAYFNKVTDCGCFGDFLKLKPWTSFSKDIFLTLFILIIVYYRSFYRQMKIAPLAVLITSVVSFGIGIYAIKFLPPIDFLPYAIGKSIPQQMKPAEKPRYKFIMTKNGQENTFQEYPKDTTFKFKEMVLLNPDKAKATITDYSVTNIKNETITDSTFVGKKLFLIFKDIQDVDSQEVIKINALSKSMAGSSIQPMLLTSVVQADFEKFCQKNNITVPFYSVDGTVLKTMARTNPCIILLNNGVVKGKWSNLCMPSKETILSTVEK